MLVLFIFILINSIVVGQNKATKKAQPIVEEGKRLYKSEMASWYGTDIFRKKYKTPEKMGGYFSFTKGEITKCVFFSQEEKPKVLGMVSFKGEVLLENSELSMEERELTDLENSYYTLRKNTLIELEKDTIFQFYQNTRPNIIPIIEGGRKRVYIMTAPTVSGIVIFGNDYLLTFNKNNEVLTKKALHQNIIPIEYSDDEKEDSSYHLHSDETEQHITATDICTLMLYGKYTKWKQHNVHSDDYLSMWNCESNKLVVMPQKTLDDIYKDQEKRKEVKDKSAKETKNRKKR